MHAPSVSGPVRRERTRSDVLTTRKPAPALRRGSAGAVASGLGGRNRARDVVACACGIGHDLCMLELRPVCENCAVELPPESTEAMICSFECTFCRACVDSVLGNVCPNCGGGFCPRPVRPRTNWNDGNDSTTYPPATKRRHSPVDPVAHRALVERIGSVPPENR